MQQYVILGRQQGEDGKLEAIGERDEVLEKLARLNTMPERQGEDLLYGPGICIQVPPDADQIAQMLMTITEEEIAWQVISRLIKVLECRLLDPTTGREFGG